MPHQIRRKFLKYISALKPILIIGVSLFLIYGLYKILLPIDQYAKENKITKQFLSSLIFNSEPSINKFQDRTNIVIFGVGGGPHDGEDLTDTIIYMSINLRQKDMVIISLPRDIWLDSLKDKINTAYHYGEAKMKGGGFILAKSAVEEVVGQPIHYAVLLDFSSFKEIIDLVGGIDVTVDREFTDNLYPIEGKENDFCGGDPNFACRYEKLYFGEGLQHMNGEQTLKFVRSRYAEGEEGTDFARSKRQQKVIISLKEAFKNPSFYKRVENINKLLALSNKAFISDMSLAEEILVGKFLWNLKESNIRKLALDTGDENKKTTGFLKNPPLWEYSGAWVLIPRIGSFEEIHKYISCQLKDPSCEYRP